MGIHNNSEKMKENVVIIKRLFGRMIGTKLV